MLNFGHHVLVEFQPNLSVGDFDHIFDSLQNRAKAQGRTLNHFAHHSDDPGIGRVQKVVIFDHHDAPDYNWDQPDVFIKSPTDLLAQHLNLTA